VAKAAFMSWQFAALIITASGAPRWSVRMWRLVPDFLPFGVAQGGELCRTTLRGVSDSSLLPKGTLIVILSSAWKCHLIPCNSPYRSSSFSHSYANPPCAAIAGSA